ncbi:MAG TPA: DoxX family membrane protein [Candidatus Paceibacterota bacterium]|nr:DoxX family membrane protein [Candidatus Paceibacterota bacterium]
MAIAFLIGRVVVGVYFLVNAYNHIVKGAHMVGYAASKGLPSPKAAIVGSGLLLLLGGLSVLFGVYTFWGIVLLLVFMVPVTFMMHDYWKAADPMQKMNERIAFQKNLAIIGFLLMLLALPVPWLYSAF